MVIMMHTTGQSRQDEEMKAPQNSTAAQSVNILGETMVAKRTVTDRFIALKMQHLK